MHLLCLNLQIIQVLEQLRNEGIEVDEHREDSENGRFGCITDPEGNRIELWEPALGE